MPDPDRKHEDLTDEERLHHFRVTRDAIDKRLEVLAALRDAPAPLAPTEFHASIRTPDLAASARFYSWLLGVEPKEWTQRYVTFVSERLRTNFVVLVDDGNELHQDTLYHLGVEVSDKAAVIDAHRRAVAAGLTDAERAEMRSRQGLDSLDRRRDHMVFDAAAGAGTRSGWG